MAEQKPTLLVVEDDPDVAEMLAMYFRDQEYRVLHAYSGEEAVAICHTRQPDMVLLDIRLPDFDGYEVARRLRSMRKTGEVPIIFLTEKRQRADRLEGLALGADDYITKPFDIQELRLRVRNALRRATQEPLTNPVTGMPEGALVDERLRECLEAEEWVICAVRLRHMADFRESYGFVAADDVLRAIGLMIQNAVRELGGLSDFIGHLQEAEFIVVTTPHNLDALVERIGMRLDQSLEYFYPLQDREHLPPEGQRLSVQLGTLAAEEGPFPDVEALKKNLRRRLR